MEVQKAIRERRAVRNYTDEPLDEATIRELLAAAVAAPNAVNFQPWAFVVVQDPVMLKRISDQSKLMMLHAELPPKIAEMIADPKFNIFYNSQTLIIICAKPIGDHPDWDCCLAGQNLMLAAREMGLGTCVIGFAWTALSVSSLKKELGIPDDYTPVLPIIVGHVREFPPDPGRKNPEILSWRMAPSPAVATV